MYNKSMSVYFENTSIKYTPANLLEIREWVTLLQELEDERAIGQICIELSRSKTVQFTYNSEATSRKSYIIAATVDQDKKEGEMAEIYWETVRFSNYSNGYRLGEEHIYSANSKAADEVITNFGTAKIVEDAHNVCVYINDKKFGSFVENYKSDSADCIKGKYVNSKLHGTVKTYRKNRTKLGKLKKVEEYVFGVLHGKSTLYHANGKLACSCYYVNGTLYGPIYNYDNLGIQYGLDFAIFDWKVDEKTFLEYDKNYGQYLKKINKML